jgi:hypothetical protein
LSILNLIGQIFKPAAELIDEMHTSEDEKLAAKTKLMALENEITSKAIGLAEIELKAKEAIVVAEANSASWLTRNWRPMVMLAFTACIMAFWFGLTPDTPQLTEDVILSMYGLVKIGVGGYIVSRGAEKIVPGVVGALKKKEET